MRIVFDTEFDESGPTIVPISFGMVRADGATYYAVSSEFDPDACCDWVKENVLPHLGDVERKPLAAITAELLEFAGPSPQFWAWYADYDWVLLCRLFGTMPALPPGWPRYCRDIKQLADQLGNPVVPMTGTAHNALDDALHAAELLKVLWARRHAANFYDPWWRSALAADLADEITEGFGFGARFSSLASVQVLPPGVTPVIGVTGPAAWFEDRDGAVVVDSPTPGHRRVRGVDLPFVLRLDLDQMNAWSFGSLREAAVRGAMELVDAQLWQRVAALFDSAPASPDRTAASGAIASARAGVLGPLSEFRLPSGVDVVVRRSEFLLAASWQHPSEQLAPDGDGWQFTGALSVAGALFPDAARRLFAQAPGPLIVPGRSL